MFIQPGNEVGNCYCGIPNKSPKSKIVGGGPTGVGEFPWLVAILYRNKNLIGQQCAGTLVGDKEGIQKEIVNFTPGAKWQVCGSDVVS